MLIQIFLLNRLSPLICQQLGKVPAPSTMGVEQHSSAPAAALETVLSAERAPLATATRQEKEDTEKAPATLPPTQLVGHFDRLHNHLCKYEASSVRPS